MGMANPRSVESPALRKSKDCKCILYLNTLPRLLPQPRQEPCLLSSLSPTVPSIVISLHSHANFSYREDGTIEGGRGGGLAAHKLGPKANQGAINAGLRALDRSGKPCRKWSKGGFTLKSFTGIVWEIPRWTAPPKPQPESSVTESTPASAEGSSKENKEQNSQVKSEASNGVADVEMQSAPSPAVANSPAPLPIPVS
jgi:hypothetical protein